MAEIAIKGNSKMGQNVYLYNLPAKDTCTPTHWCLYGRNGKPACYALRNNFCLPTVIEAAKKRLEISKQPDFVEKMSEFIRDKKVNYFRMHSSGDFYSNEYVQKWLEIAKNCPDTLFRSSTRRLDLTDSIIELNSLSNVIIRESLDLDRPEQQTSLPFSALAHLPIVQRESCYKCPNDCDKCGFSCWKNRWNTCFDEH